MSKPTYNTNHRNRTKTMRICPIYSTGKERDAETGYGYFGARYMDHELMTMWLSVDRYADKYPFISPYAYCEWNPIKLTDPSGDTIFNAHEKYKDISADLLRLTKDRERASGLSNIFKRLSIDNKIGRLKKNNLKYQNVQGALDAFKTANPEEYNRLDNLEYNGRSVNIYVSASDKMHSTDGAVGTTHPRFLVDRNTGDVVFISRINICLYKLAFVSGNNGLSTLANEMGDAVFAAALPKSQIQGYYDIKNYKQGYWGECSSNFSRDYEHYIMKPGESELPDPYSYTK